MDSSLQKVLSYYRTLFDSSADLVIREFEITGTKAAIFSLENMVDKQLLAEAVLEPIINADTQQLEPKQKFEYIYNNTLATVDQSKQTGYNDATDKLMSGFSLLFLDGCDFCIAFGVQGYKSRSVSEPENETMQRGSREGLVEILNVNISMIRRRMKNPNLMFERHVVGSVSRTNICLCYLRGAVSPKILEKLRESVKKLDARTVLDAGFISSQLVRGQRRFLFSSSGYTERPDTICGKMGEGRIVILVDGTPTAIIVPYLFIENFQCLDDYSNRPFFATFVRWLRFLSFFLALFLPGLYVSITAFHPELLPEPLLLKIAEAEASTPFPVMTEAFILLVMYEIMREAGLRVPKSLSHAVSIVAALVVGDAAVSSGLVGAPTLMVIAVTAVASYATPSLYEQVAVFRLIFVILAGVASFWGVMLGAFVILVNICAEMAFDIPFSAPVSPVSFRMLKDVLIREPWKKLEHEEFLVQNVPGSQVGEAHDE